MVRFIAVTLLARIITAQVIPLPLGPYSVNWTNLELVDESRVDPFNATHARRLMVSRFRPVDSCKTVCETPYMPAELGGIEHDIFADLLEDDGWPRGLFADLKLQTCCEIDDSAPASTEQFPTILFGPAYAMTRLLYSATAQYLSSLGYEVIVMDHPYEMAVVAFPDGEIALGQIAIDFEDATSTEFGLEVRNQDASFVLDTLDITRAVYVGHFLGGASAAACVAKDSRIQGGVNLDGNLWGPEQYRGSPRPFLTIGSALHDSKVEDSWKHFFNATKSFYPGAWSKELNIKQTVLHSYSDLSLIGAATGLDENEVLAGMVFGSIPAERLWKIMVNYLGNFFRFVLEGGEEGLLSGDSPEYPEVVFL